MGRVRAGGNVDLKVEEPGMRVRRRRRDCRALINIDAVRYFPAPILLAVAFAMLLHPCEPPFPRGQSVFRNRISELTLPRSAQTVLKSCSEKQASAWDVSAGSTIQKDLYQQSEAPR
jgi:hypothetical protein